VPPSRPSSDPFRAIADPTRRLLLDALRAGERRVTDLAAPLDVSLPAVSQHLGVLLQAGLVSEQRFGRERRYALTPRPLVEVHDWLSPFEVFWSEKLDALEEHLRARGRRS
jgi:DNA-binding transcriptional ArsR family regulator